MFKQPCYACSTKLHYTLRQPFPDPNNSLTFQVKEEKRNSDFIVIWHVQINDFLGKHYTSSHTHTHTVLLPSAQKCLLETNQCQQQGFVLFALRSLNIRMSVFRIARSITKIKFLFHISACQSEYTCIYLIVMFTFQVN